MDDDKFLLSWNDFATNAPNTFRKLWSDQDFTDVTLATEDDKQIRAHKVILSSSSQFFRKLLIKNPHPNPLIYLKGIRHHELAMAIQFIYHGQCHVANEDIPDFLTTGIDLMINGLMETIDSEHLEPKENIARNENPSQSENIHQTMESQLHNSSTTSSYRNVQRSVGNQHKVATQKSHLKAYQQYTHEGVKYSCDLCDCTATTQSNLRTHKRSKHEGVRYICDHCDYNATQESSLKTHKQSQHNYNRDISQQTQKTVSM